MLMRILTFFSGVECCNLSFGLATKIRGCKVADQEGDSRMISHALGSAKSVKEWTFTCQVSLEEWLSNFIFGQDFCLNKCYFILFTKVLLSVNGVPILFVLVGLIQASDSEIFAQSKHKNTCHRRT
jgi:hypothetical protein